MRRLVLGTAGHIDHGKTSLVRALTGIDTDRLPDEKRRGITIDLGFASLPLPGGTLSIVDVPGHEAFVRNMVAGATGIDLVLLVVAADEGAMPQTREHLAIIELLGIRRGIVALTKSDLVDPEWLELVREDVSALLADTALDGAPILTVSARTGHGIDALATALAAAAAAVPPRTQNDLFRMPIDRVFTVRGTGTVVTGTVWSGTLHRDSHVRVLPAAFAARVRGLQQHGEDCEEVVAGARAAVALGGTDRQAITRGDTLLVGDGWEPAGILTVALQRLRDANAAIRTRQRVRVHVGTAEVLARVALLGPEPGPGEMTLAQLRLEAPLIARAGDHAVIRSYSPVVTIAGGVVLEAPAPKRKRLTGALQAALVTMADRLSARATAGDHAQAVLEAAVTLAGPAGLEHSRAPFATGLAPAIVDAALAGSTHIVRAGDLLVEGGGLRAAVDAVIEGVGRFHQQQPLLDGIEKEPLRKSIGTSALFDLALSALLTDGRVVTAGNALALPGHRPSPDTDAQRAIERLMEIYRAAGLEPPELAELPADLAQRSDLPLLIRLLERDGFLLRLSPTRPIATTAISDAVAALRTQLASREQLDVSDFKEVLKLTRKHLIPLLEHLDAAGITRRAGEHRILTTGRQAPLDA